MKDYKPKYLTGLVFWIVVLMILAYSTSPLLSPECQATRNNVPEICAN